MTITDIGVFKGDTWRVEIDGSKEQSFFVNESIVQQFLLKKGQRLCGEALAQIKSADLRRKAKRHALYLLGTREYCERELFKKLTKYYPEDAVGGAVEYVRELGYIDDEEYAEKLAKNLIHTKRYGLRKAKYEMLHRGLDACIVENALAEYSQEDIDEEIMSLLQRRYSDKIQDFDARRRTTAALARRGYDFGAIKRCIEVMLDGADFDEEFDEECE